MAFKMTNSQTFLIIASIDFLDLIFQQCGLLILRKINEINKNNQLFSLVQQKKIATLHKILSAFK